MAGVTIWNLWIPKHSKNLLQPGIRKSVILDMRDPIFATSMAVLPNFEGEAGR